MRFDLICEKFSPGEVVPQNNEVKRFTLDTKEGKLWIEENRYLTLRDGKLALREGIIGEGDTSPIVAPWNSENPPGKSRNIKRLKIQMGLSCNYECSYCSQRFVERPVQGNPEKVDELIAKLQSAFDLPKYGTGLKIEFWGGEPLVYWKTMKPLAEKLRALYPSAIFSIITNGSLLTKDIVDWLEAYGFGMSISHDGPGQHVRGPCPITEGSEETREAIRYAVERFHRRGKGSFGSMLSRKNISRLAVQKWFDEQFGPGIQIGEGGMIEAYDEDGFELSLNTKAEHFEFRRAALKDLTCGEKVNFSGVHNRVQAFIDMMVKNQPLNAEVGMKCGMESETSVAVDMLGNVITCQNTSSVHVAGNGESHLCGTIDDLENVKTKAATHWADRPHCQKCPVVSVCRGSCMYIYGDNWWKTCDSQFSDNIVLLALAVLQLTGYLPVFIDANHLPDHRKDIWGSILEHKEAKPRFPIPVKAA